MTTISAIVITKNEVENIQACLESVSWADEIIVVDSGSTDGTYDICKEYTDHVYSHDWPGFGPQKNKTLKYASKEWVFTIDADERVSNQLKDEIKNVISNTSYDAFSIPRLSSYCGKFIHHGGWRPDYVIRLFLREKGRFSDDIIHERVIVKGVVGKLSADIIHHSFRDIESVSKTVNVYSTLSAEQKFKSGKKSGLAKAVLHGVTTFFMTYFLKAGFLDGKHGFMLAFSNAEGTYYKYLKLMELCNRSNSEDSNEF